MSERLAYGRQWIDEDDVAAVVETLRSDFLTTGPAVEAFEQALCATSGAEYAVVVNSGTAALHAMYAAVGVGPGRTVVTSPLTFAATANAARYLGATVRFVDVDAATGTIDPVLVAEAIDDATVAVVGVDYAGHPADYGGLARVLEGRSVRLLADAAHSLGARSQGRPVGKLANASAVSFHPVKPVTTAEGGAVLTDDARVARTAARFRTHGITRAPEELCRHEGPWWYEMHELGYNYRMPDVLCALGTSQLRRLGTFIERRRRIATRYQEAFADTTVLQLPVERPDIESGWHLYVVRVREAGRRRAFFEGLRNAGLGVQVHYIPVPYHPHYRNLGFEPGHWPVAEDFYARAVSLPIYPAMTDDDVERVVATVHRVARAAL